MKPIVSFLIFISLSSYSFGQSTQFKIYGTISGKYNSKIYLFFDNHYRQRDSLSSEIKEGKFFFQGNITKPVLGRLHLDQESTIADFYVDGNTIHVYCSNTIKTSLNSKKEKDTLNQLIVSHMEGSPTQDSIIPFEAWKKNLEKSSKSKKEKNKAYYEKLLKFVENHPKNKASLYLLGKASDLEYNQVLQISKLIDTSLRQTYESESLNELLAMLKNKPETEASRSIGAVFHDVILPDTAGNGVDTKQFRGNYTLIEFWASWCGPCREANPSLKKLYAELDGKKFEIVGISVGNNNESWKEAIIKDELTWPQLLDGRHGKLSSLYNIDAIPSNILIDKKGKIMGVDLSTKEIEKKLRNNF